MILGIEFEPTSLAITRLISTFVSVFAVIMIVAIWRHQPPDPGRRIVPRAVLTFTGGWSVVLTFITSTLLIQGSQAISDGWFRTIYGMAFVWTIAGLLWIVYLGQKAIWKARMFQKMREDGEI